MLQKNQFDWLVIGLVVALLYSPGRLVLQSYALRWWRREATPLVVNTWTMVTLLMPMFVRTKLSWYLNSFYPAFALGLGWLFASVWAETAAQRRRVILILLLMLAVVIAECRLIWYSTHRRSLAHSTQGLLLAEKTRLKGHRVFRSHWDNSEVFVLGALVGAEPVEVATLEEFMRASDNGDCWLSAEEVDEPVLKLVQMRGRRWLYCRE